MKLVHKLVLTIKKEGLLSTFKKVICKIKLNFTRIFFYFSKDSNIIKNTINFNQYKRIIIFENQFGWEKIMKQRPQQIANAATPETLFIYGTTHMEIGNAKGIKKIKNNLYLADLVLYKNEFIKELKNIENKYIMLYSTDYIPLEIIKPYLNADFKIIYEFVDGIDENLCGKETAKLLHNRHDLIINNYNPFIIATASTLYNNVKLINNNSKAKLITNGVDYDHFAVSQTELPKEMQNIKQDGSIIIGYYGALASWFDYDLVKKIANADKKYKIILIGLDYDKTLDKSGILELENVYYLGKKTYDELPKYLNGFDICIIPFIINEITLSTSPVKIFEYMAARKPIVTSALPECRKYNSVLVAENDAEFLEKIKEAENKLHDLKYLDLLTKEAKENNWNTKFNELIDFISTGEMNI